MEQESLDSERHPLARGMIRAGRERDGWDEEHERWAELLRAAFGQSGFWQSSKDGKEERYRAVAEELVSFVGAPEGAISEVQWWATLLAQRFGGMGFWQSPPAWKQLAYENVVREIYLAKRLLAGPLLEALEQSAAPTTVGSGLSTDSFEPR